MFRGLFVFVFLVLGSIQAHAQQLSWIQVEAQPTLNAAQDAARGYAARLDDVNGFYLGGNWYGIALGPYAEDDAEALLRRLRATGQIPRDSFLTDGRRFGQQFWPVGSGAAQPAPVVIEPVETPTPTEAPAPIAEVETTLPDETVNEARASEGLLTREEKQDLQIALRWAGFYNAAIDGAFGRGTRNSMSLWQESRGYEVTGVLTTAQRAALIAEYNAILEGVDLTLQSDSTVGIEMLIPAGLVEFDAYDAPFARYIAKDGSGVQVLLISQPGDRARLGGMYEILQTLEIVPFEGERSLRGDSFIITGQNDQRQTFITASTQNGEIKGFALVWPAGDAERFDRVLSEMGDSFARIGGVLNPAVVASEQSVDLLAGLEIRRPKVERTGFFVDAAGTVVTAADTIGSCERVTLNEAYDATVTYSDDQIAILSPRDGLTPLDHVVLQANEPRLNSPVSIAGFSFGGVLARPTLTFGELADVQGLAGENVNRLTLAANDGDIGGPVFDAGGAVIGVLLPAVAKSGQVLPSDVAVAAKLDRITTALAETGANTTVTDQFASMPAATLTTLAADVTVLVSCW